MILDEKNRVLLLVLLGCFRQRTPRTFEQRLGNFQLFRSFTFVIWLF